MKNESKEPPFDTEAYANYCELLDEYHQESDEDLLESIKNLGFKLDQQIGKLIDKLDKEIDTEEPDDFTPENDPYGGH